MDYETELEDFVLLYTIADNALTLLRSHRFGPPGIRSIQDDLKCVCQDAVGEWKRINGDGT